MLAVVKTPLTKIRIKGRVPNKLIDLLAEEYGNALQITPDPEDEKMDVFRTDWYKNLKKRLSPGSYLKVFRQNKNMTQAELGKALGGLPRQHISNMENGIRPISKKIALKLSKLFDVSVEKFIS
jgi:DNA-binding XRE family transcriptional regulator